jgi:hypothetical protein
MDILSHALWAGAAGQSLRRRHGSGRRVLAATVAMGAVPDLMMLVPVIAWSAFQPEPLGLLHRYVTATPGIEPLLPPVVAALSHHLHCIMHSAIIAAVIGLIAWWKRPALVLPMVGWWLHIALDIPTHSSDYYAVPFLYPLTYWGVNGIPWTTPWLLALNYLAIAGVYTLLFKARSATRPPSAR